MIRRTLLLMALVMATPASADPFWRIPANGDIPSADLGLAPVQHPPTGTCTPDDWSGIWYSIYGQLDFKIDAGTLEGSYEYLNGHIKGTLDSTGCVLTGKWDQDPSHTDPSDTGPLVFTLAADRASWTGSWQFDSDPDYIGEWTGYRDASALE